MLLVASAEKNPLGHFWQYIRDIYQVFMVGRYFQFHLGLRDVNTS